MDANWPRAWPKMAKLYIFDPEGDVLLTFEHVSAEAVVGPESESFSKDCIVSDSGASAETDSLSEDVLDRPNPAPEPIRCKPPTDITNADGIMKPESSTSAFSGSNSDTKARAEQIQMRVSSKHLILASRTFRTSLGSDTYTEGLILQNEGSLVVPLPDEDPDAMIILMNIIHGLSSKVPRRVDLNMLSSLAVAVNHRHMHEAVGLWSDTWVENLKADEGLPGSYAPEKLLPWLFILWVFRKEEDFQNISQILERGCDDSLQSEVDAVYVGSYIPASVISTIQEKRMCAIDKMIHIIHELITKYSGPNILCDNGRHFSCDATLLGSLVKASSIIGIWPRPEEPYPGITIKTLAHQIRNFKVMDDCEMKGRGGYYGSSASHRIKHSIEASIRSLEDHTVGLHMTSFLPNTGKREE